tara:strand:+ start:1590 stop:2225 length:636 start_codon:yes stop_codon:yes gene_type:complete
VSSIDKLKSTISQKGGLAPANRFSVIFTPPSQSILNLDIQGLIGSAVSGNFSPSQLVNDPRDIAILCQSVTLPGSTIATYEEGLHKQVRKFPYTFIDDEVTMSFLLTNDYYMRKMFDNWMSNIVNKESHLVGYKNDYSVDVIIQQLNQKNIPVYGVKLEKAFPTTISSSELSQDSGEFVRFEVTWAYDKYKPEGPLSSTLSTIRSGLDILG